MDERIEEAIYKFSDIEPGMKKQFKLTITCESMLKDFAKLSGDYTPLHADDAKYAKTTSFKRKICHGLLLVSFFSQLIGMHLPARMHFVFRIQ